MMYFLFFFSLLFSFGALYSGQTFCVYMGCTDIDYCIYDIWGLWMALWFTFMVICMDMCMDVCLWMCLGMYLGLHLWLCVWVMGLDPPRGLVQQISGPTSP